MDQSTNAACAEAMRSFTPQVCGRQLCDDQESLNLSTITRNMSLSISRLEAATESISQCIHDSATAWTRAAEFEFS
jgi:hypothetical protein